MNVFERMGVGLRAWFDAWFIEGAAEAIAPTVRAKALPDPNAERERSGARETPPAAMTQPPKSKPAPTSRSEALTLLEVLQRDARLIDFLKEDLSGYDDAQIGAAVRDVHRESAKVLDRLFALQPVLTQEEGGAVKIGDEQPGRLRLVGNVREGVAQGMLVHSGWQASKLELPKWSGASESERIVAPAEVEV